MNIFRSRIRKSIADDNLQVALDNNARRRREGRLAATSSLPDFQDRRSQAHAIKAQVIADLDSHLARFIASVEQNGIRVHRAQDSNAAMNIFMEIARGVEISKRLGGNSDPLLIAKSKSMVSEEIDFNHCVEKAGIRVVETDLGEYIVQLRGERPSHIITPAVHLRRGQVGKLFEEKLGIPYTEDIPVLTNTARKVLRQVFLGADIGVSGVNFGVAETGTLAIVTNEGNGRMVTSLPKVHVALMGIERIIPKMDDLALFLSLLPRSATGQKLSVYTNLIKAPLPGQVRHLILVDNGRSALRASPLAEALYCIRCGACLNACPVFRELSGHAYGSIYPGPIGSVISCAMIDPQFDSLAQASTLCGACKEACPMDIDLPGMLLRIRAGQSPHKRSPGEQEDGNKPRQGVGIPAMLKLGLAGFRVAAGNARLFRFLQGLGGIFSRVYSPHRQQMRLPAWTGWGSSKDMSRLAVRPFRAQWKDIHQEVAEKPVSKPVNEEAEPAIESPRVTLVEQFTRELEAVGGHAYLLPEKEVSKKVADLLSERRIDRALVDGTGKQFAGRFEVVHEPDASVRAGITGALAGIADTGSLVIEFGDGMTNSASLLTEVHIAVLKASQLLPGLESAMRLPEVTQAGVGVIITGPSRTADIEMTLTIGVHGPGELHVILIDDSMPV